METHSFWADDETPDIGIDLLLLASRQWSSRIESYPDSADLQMRSTQQMSITLPIEMATLVKAKVASGEYASESEVIRDGLRALLARDRAMEDWLRDEVMPAAAALNAEPDRALSTEQVREHMAAKRQRKNPGKP
ncbi:putative addiction module antidote protein, CC2985 family [Pseudomonas orientalis]|uniref:Antitoxin ParD n=2 Tax=Pseudomonas orientalis TaxID=76758 RepID=A0A8B3Y6V0_9PSED|nr:type II toxin-antitoxin system ParD family antitoxin [Pseudomonas orientalis]SDU36937.1 putative addiction module antidote protein, CC2985 family [Pseudomonas orientalis]